MVKAKIFHAGTGKWEVRYTQGKKIQGIGYFFTKPQAKKIASNINKGKSRFSK